MRSMEELPPYVRLIVTSRPENLDVFAGVQSMVRFVNAWVIAIQSCQS